MHKKHAKKGLLYSIVATIRIGREIQCFPYVGFSLFQEMPGKHETLFKSCVHLAKHGPNLA